MSDPQQLRSPDETADDIGAHEPAALEDRRSWLRRRRDRRLEAHALEVGRRLRSSLDTQAILTMLVWHAQRQLRADRSAAWLTTGKEPARLAFGVGVQPSQPAPPDVIATCARRWRPTRGPGANGEPAVAVPILTPRRRLIGVLECERADVTPDEERFVRAIATEAGSALEAAALYEEAVRSKEKMEAILERVADGVVVTDARGIVLEASESAQIVMERRPAAAAGRPCEEVLGLRIGERVLECGGGCPLLTDGSQAAGIEVYRRRLDGRRQPLLVSAAALRDAGGAVTEYVHSLRDISRLKEADEAKTMFLATASHELKTPLTIVQGFAQTLLASDSRLDGSDRRQALAAIERRALQLNSIVDRLLLSSRIESGRVRIDTTPIDLAPVVRDCVESLHAATGTNVELDCGADLRAFGDAEAVATIVDHLLDNARKYAIEDPHIEVTAEADDEQARIHVTDHGIGMDAEQQRHCFDKFWQAESSDIRRFGGTGIGLYIVKSLAEGMGGTATVRSEPGRGSTFTIALRRVARAAPSEPAAGDDRHAVSSEPSVIREFMRQIGVPSTARRKR